MERQAKQLSKQLFEVGEIVEKFTYQPHEKPFSRWTGHYRWTRFQVYEFNISIDAEKRLIANSVTENLKVY